MKCQNVFPHFYELALPGARHQSRLPGRTRVIHHGAGGNFKKPENSFGPPPRTFESGRRRARRASRSRVRSHFFAHASRLEQARPRPRRTVRDPARVALAKTPRSRARVDSRLLGTSEKEPPLLPSHSRVRDGSRPFSVETNDPSRRSRMATSPTRADAATDGSFSDIDMEELDSYLTSPPVRRARAWRPSERVFARRFKIPPSPLPPTRPRVPVSRVPRRASAPASPPLARSLTASPRPPPSFPQEMINDDGDDALRAAARARLAARAAHVEGGMAAQAAAEAAVEAAALDRAAAAPPPARRSRASTRTPRSRTPP